LLQTFTFLDLRQHATIFAQMDGAAVWLQQICAQNTAQLSAGDSPPSGARGLAVLDTPGGRMEGDHFRLVESRFRAESAFLAWAVGEGTIHWESTWLLEAVTGIWSRKDALRNTGTAPVSLTRCLARFAFTPGWYEVYTQGSSWSHENQGVWHDLKHGSLVLRSQGGRTTQGASPYLFLREKGSAQGIAFHILPRGNWVMQVSCAHMAGLQPYLVVELGLNDETLCLQLSPGEIFDLPEILIQPVPHGIPEMGAPDLHRYALAAYFPNAKLRTPVVYNTWFDAFEFLEVERLRAQLAAAKDLGCEVFTVDAGWYGNGEGAWHANVGDWSEKLAGAFHGRMVDFAGEVRAAGLGFGLWMEPERNHANAPAVRANADWFLPGGGGFFYPDLTQPDAYAYIRAEMSRLIDTYQLAWMKVDFNFELGRDVVELAHYYQRWYALLDELRANYPQLYLEGCASGGMRLELSSLSHFDGHFLSDTVNPMDVLRITQGALLRLPPGRLTKWAVLRPAGDGIAQYGMPLNQTPERLLTPGGAGWEEAAIASVDFIARTAMPGAFGLSGDLAGLPPGVRSRLRQHIQFFKTWREFIAASLAHLLTPVSGVDDRRGWVAFQLQKPDQSSPSLLFVYRLNDGASSRFIRLRGLDPDQAYQINAGDSTSMPAQISRGSDMMHIGLLVELAQFNSAAVFVITNHPPVP
jgi:alpha-galactosidase